MGRIRIARDRRLGRTVAIKELLHPAAALRSRFELEARITAKLQHPAIVNVLEAGRWPDGEPFYAMKLVDGQPLSKMITGRRSLEARLSLLPNVIAVVDALAYAHDRRVIHRDLKPSNILIGEYGETVVIDWGLAKDLGEQAEAGADAHDAVRAATDAQTVAGSVMGTPAYMPLEQAAGEPVDMRADVYALGAILYHMLAGQPPYSGITSDETIRAVVDAPAVSLASRAPEAPPDLVAIVNKAMARTPDARYPSAKELGADLKRFQTGQLVGAHRYSPWQLVRRWLRRHRVAVTVAGIAAMLLVGVAGVSVHRIMAAEATAIHERDIAEQRRADVEDVMGFMLGDLGAKLQSFGKVPLLDDVARKAVAYYDRNAPTTARQLRERAVALSLVGDVLYQQNDLDHALCQHRIAATLLTAQQISDPAQAADDLLSREHGRIGDLLLRRGDLEGTSAQYQAALASAQRAARDGAPQHQQALAMAFDQLGQLEVSRGEPRRGLEDLRKAWAITQRLLASDPGGVAWLKDAWSEHAAIGDALLRLGDPAAAASEHQAALDVADRWAAADPKSAEPLRERSISTDRLAELARLRGDIPGALARYRTGLAIAETLAARDPSSAYLQRDVAVSHATIARVLQDQHDATGALHELDAALAITERLAASDPTNATWQQDVAFMHVLRGELLRDRDDDAAIRELRAGIAAVERVIAVAPSNVAAIRLQYNAYDDLGGALAARQAWGPALDAYRAGVAAAQRLVTLDPKDERARQDLADAREDYADAERRAQKR
jgi:tetratricopeptide (TPR) repeat protein/tRNA A-37 threonylcarbamoyl transferase component Bud32